MHTIRNSYFWLFFGISGRILGNLSPKYLWFREEFFYLHSHPGKIQIAADGYYDFEIVNMKSLQDWIVYMLIIPSWHFFAKNIQN